MTSRAESIKAGKLLSFLQSDNLVIFTIRVFGYISIGLLIFVASHELLKKWISNQEYLQNTAAITAFLGVTIFTWFYRTKVERKSWNSIGLTIGSLRAKDFCAGLFFGCGTFMLVITALEIAGGAHFAPRPFQYVGLAALVLPLVFNFFQPAIEEVLFRGYLCTAFAERFNVATSCIIVGIIFAFLHKDSPGFGPTMVFNAIAMTSCMYVARLETGSLLWPIGWHMGWNLLQDYNSVHNLFPTRVFPESTITLGVLLVATILYLKAPLRGLRSDSVE